MATLKDAVYGAAVGDAFGVPYEFCGRNSFAVKSKMIGGGSHGQPAGTFSDDTSMMLACCDSLKENNGKIDIEDMRRRFVEWARYGKYAIDASVFDIGMTVSSALSRGRGMTGERDNGNGSLMRIIPLAFISATDEEIAQVSAITHAHRISIEACQCYVKIARLLTADTPKDTTVKSSIPKSSEFERLAHIKDLDQNKISSGGYVVHTLEAALWCLMTTDNYKDCVMKAVDLGGDTDTTGCVAGGLAGILYGKDSIPKAWLETLRGKDIIEACLF